jgi:hypothetical protein
MTPLRRVVPKRRQNALRKSILIGFSIACTATAVFGMVMFNTCWNPLDSRLKKRKGNNTTFLLLTTSFYSVFLLIRLIQWYLVYSEAIEIPPGFQNEAGPAILLNDLN